MSWYIITSECLESHLIASYSWLAKSEQDAKEQYLSLFKYHVVIDVEYSNPF